MSRSGDILQNADVIKAKQASNTQGSLCWRCKNVFFNKCKKPIDGWNAIRNDIKFYGTKLNEATQKKEKVLFISESYYVLECPNFVSDD